MKKNYEMKMNYGVKKKTYTDYTDLLMFCSFIPTCFERCFVLECCCIGCKLQEFVIRGARVASERRGQGAVLRSMAFNL